MPALLLIKCYITAQSDDSHGSREEFTTVSVVFECTAVFFQFRIRWNQNWSWSSGLKLMRTVQTLMNVNWYKRTNSTWLNAPCQNFLIKYCLCWTLDFKEVVWWRGDVASFHLWIIHTNCFAWIWHSDSLFIENSLQPWINAAQSPMLISYSSLRLCVRCSACTYAECLMLHLCMHLCGCVLMICSRHI